MDKYALGGIVRKTGLLDVSVTFIDSNPENIAFILPQFPPEEDSKYSEFFIVTISIDD